LHLLIVAKIEGKKEKIIIIPKQGEDKGSNMALTMHRNKTIKLRKNNLNSSN